MSKTALFIRHQALPGKREEVRRVWEAHVKPRAAANPAHEAYFFCFADADADLINVFQLCPDRAALEAFLSGEWYAAYLKEVSQFIASPPQMTQATLVWAKPPALPNAAS